jgi:hypothetical protein
MTSAAERTLTLVSATLGFAGAVILTSLWLRGAPNPSPSVLLVVSTTIMAALCGRVGARRIRTPLGFAGAAILAGGANGLVLATVAAALGGDIGGFVLMVGGFIFGMICAVPFVPALAIAFAATQRVGRARPGSLVDEADRRAPWTAVCITILVVGLGLAFFEPRAVDLTVSALLFARGLGAVLLTVLTLRSWSRARGWQRAFAAAEPANDTASDVPGGADEHDLGIGDEARELRHRGDAYRAGVRTAARLRGHTEQARRILRFDLLLGALAMALSVATASWLVYYDLTHGVTSYVEWAMRSHW